MVMAGQEEEEAAGVGRLSTGAGADRTPDLEPTLENDPESELKPSWTFDGKTSDSEDGDKAREDFESASTVAGSR